MMLAFQVSLSAPTGTMNDQCKVHIVIFWFPNSQICMGSSSPVMAFKTSFHQTDLQISTTPVLHRSPTTWAHHDLHALQVQVPVRLRVVNLTTYQREHLVFRVQKVVNKDSLPTTMCQMLGNEWQLQQAMQVWPRRVRWTSLPDGIRITKWQVISPYKVFVGRKLNQHNVLKCITIFWYHTRL